MSIGNLLVAIFLLGLLVFRFTLDTEGRERTRLLAVALLIGTLRFNLAAFLYLAPSQSLIDSLLIASDVLYVLFFFLLALHYTSRHLPLVGFWVPQSVLLVAILVAGYLVSNSVAIASAGYMELVRTLLFLTATLAFTTICRSREMLDNHPVFWIPTLIIATTFGIATGAKIISTIVQFSGNGPAGLLITMSSSLGAVATLLLLIFLTANISWFRNSQ